MGHAAWPAYGPVARERILPRGLLLPVTSDDIVF